MAHDYVALAEAKATLELNGESFADDDLARAITAASRGLDNITHRRFWADTDATSVRYYSADDCRALRIDDLITLTSVETDPTGDGTFEDAWAAADYVLEPLNAAADGWPYTRIGAHRNGNFVFPTCYPRTVKVTGKFGWAEVPAGVKEATVMLAARLMNRARSAPFGVVSFGMEGAVHIARTDPDVMFLVGPYIKHRVAVA
jgi:hypothetical protein